MQKDEMIFQKNELQKIEDETDEQNAKDLEKK